MIFLISLRPASLDVNAILGSWIKLYKCKSFSAIYGGLLKIKSKDSFLKHESQFALTRK